MTLSFKRIVAFVIALVLSLSVVVTALAYDTIPYGEQSDDVRKMQSKLKSKGYYSGRVDGKFGPETRKAVIKYQKAIGITADGKPGDKTLTALYEGRSAINQANDTELKNQITATNPRTLYYGCTGARVRGLQRALKKAGVYGGSIDGVYGDLTRDAVIKYQRQKGLHADGMAGVKTIASLNASTNSNIYTSMILDVGSSGQEVKAVARFLTDRGYMNGYANEYTQDMADAVKKWQTDTGKTVTGTITENQYNDIVLGKEK